MSSASAALPAIRAHEIQRAVRNRQNTVLRNHGPRMGVVGAACLPVLLLPSSVWACAACYGQSDSPMAAGMNWGILSLLGIIVFVLGGVAGFFVFLARRSAKLAATNADQLLSAEAADQPSPGKTAFTLSNPELLTGRGNFGHVSTLARRRSQCARTAPRPRN